MLKREQKKIDDSDSNDENDNVVKSAKQPRRNYRRRRLVLRKRRQYRPALRAVELKKIISQQDQVMTKNLNRFSDKEIEVMKYYHEKKCEICMTPNEENQLVLCDRCDDAYHIRCITQDPPLLRVPDDAWICQVCIKQINNQMMHKEQMSTTICYRCRQPLDQQAIEYIREEDIVKGERSTLFITNPKRINGHPCRHCGHTFHFKCQNERINAINCTECEAKIRRNGPKSYYQFVEYIEKSQIYDQQFHEHYELIHDVRPSLPQDRQRLKFLGLRLPRLLANPYPIIKSFSSLHYALETQNIRFTDQQIYMKSNARVSDNNQQSLSRYLQLNQKDEMVFEQFKRLSGKGYFGPLEIAQSKYRGFYVRALEFIPVFTIITEYVGEVVTSRQSLIWKSNDSIFSLIRTPRSKTSLDICPNRFANISKFLCGINNSQRFGRLQENVQTMKFVYHGKARVLFYAKKNIQAGDILFIDYNGGGFDEYPTDHFL